MNRFNAYTRAVSRSDRGHQDDYVPTTERTDIPKKKIIKLPYGMVSRDGTSLGQIVWRKRRGD